MDSIQNTTYEYYTLTFPKFSIKECLYKSIFTFTITNTGEIHIIKNVYGKKGELTLREFLRFVINNCGADTVTGSNFLDAPIKKELIGAIDNILGRYDIE